MSGREAGGHGRAPRGKAIGRSRRLPATRGKSAVPADPDVRSILKEFDLPSEFPRDVVREAERAAAKDTAEERARRADRTKDEIFTIDPSDARDHDDAISVERRGEGFRLGVHIADVSFFVEEKTRLDREAYQRGNSVYLPGFVVPMIPEILSNDVCSLRPNRPRLAQSVIIDFDGAGAPGKWRFEETVIRSRAKLAYEEVQAFFDGASPNERIERVAGGLGAARDLARLLWLRRSEAGAIDFDVPEAKIVLDGGGEVVEVGRRPRLESHRLIEEFMLAANRVVAQEAMRKGQEFLYRVHGRPDAESLRYFSYMMERLGFSFPITDPMPPIRFARFLMKVRQAPESDIVQELMLRAMQKAVYQRENIGHFGLAFRHYTHFTSPIRRYPDLLVHRMLRRLRGRSAYLPSYARRLASTIDAAGKHCSETERRAEAAERRAVRVKQARYMARRVGEEYDGLITGVVRFGFFVRLGELGVDGLVRTSTLGDGPYRFDERNARLVGMRSRRIFRIGDTLRVGVARADAARGEVDLFLPEERERARGRRRR